MIKRFISDNEAKELITYLQNDGFHQSFEKGRNKLLFQENEDKVHLRLSLENQFIDNGVKSFNGQYLMVLIQSGSASIGVYQKGKCLKHKVFGAYMVRKKQGKSQIKHLKTKGKSRAGSRIRLASTLEFFEQINERLTENLNDFEIERIALSCSKILIPLLYGSNVPTPFQKNDDRLVSVPFDVKQPNFEEMTRIHRLISKNEVQVEESLLLEELRGLFDFLEAP